VERRSFCCKENNIMKRRLLAGAALAAAALIATTTMPMAQGAMTSVWEGVYTADQAEKGRVLFEDNCVKCHGGTLDGMDEIPPLKGSSFMADWETQSAADLINRIHVTMPMDNPGKLSTESSTLIVTYLLQQNGLPAGTAPLTDANAGQTKITAIKPGG
jgi:mono/diheme cytochrome c family protein